MISNFTFKGYILILAGLILSVIPNSFLPYYVTAALIYDPELRIEGHGFVLNGFLADKIFIGGNIYGKQVEIREDELLNLTIPISSRDINVTCHLSVCEIVEPLQMRREVKVYDAELIYCALILYEESEGALTYKWSKNLHEIGSEVEINLKSLELELNVTPPYRLAGKVMYEYKIETELADIHARSKEFEFGSRPITIWELKVEGEKLTVNYFENYTQYEVPIVNPLLKALRDQWHAHQILLALGALIQGYDIIVKRKVRSVPSQ